jgi:hypothetical protein
VHPSNAPSPIVVIFVVSAILVKLVHPENAKYPILARFWGIMILVSPAQPENARLPMLLTSFGIEYSPVIAEGYAKILLVILSNRIPSMLR